MYSLRNHLGPSQLNKSTSNATKRQFETKWSLHRHKTVRVVKKKTLTRFIRISFMAAVRRGRRGFGFEGAADGYGGGRRRSGFGTADGHRVGSIAGRQEPSTPIAFVCSWAKKKRRLEWWRAVVPAAECWLVSDWRATVSPGCVRTNVLSVGARSGHCDAVGPWPIILSVTSDRRNGRQIAATAAARQRTFGV